MARTDTLGNFLIDVASAIREKKGTTDTILASNFDTEIASIEGASKYAPEYISFYGYGGTELNDEIANLDTSNIISMNAMFGSCNQLLSLNLNDFITSNVVNMTNMFYGCSKLTTLDLSNFYTPKLKSITGMFNSCIKLATLDISNFNTINITDMSRMFATSSNLTTLILGSNFNTSNVTTATSMFEGSGITSLPELDAGNMTNISRIFYYCQNLENFGGLKDLGKAYNTSYSANYSNYTLHLSYSTLLTHDSLMNIINNLYDIKSKGCNAQSLILGEVNLAKLTSDEIAIATNKGWNVS